MNFLLIIVKCLIYTIIIELLVALILSVRDKKDLIYVVLVNIITNPIVVSSTIFINSKFGYSVKNIALYSLEILAVLVEGFIYLKKLKYKKLNPFILSLLLNLSSYLIGGIINMF